MLRPATLSSMVLPRPSGPHAVGFVDYEWQPAASEHTSRPAACALVRLYYPAEGAFDAARCGRWVPSSDYLPSYGYYLRVPRLLSALAMRWLAGSVQQWAMEHAPPAPAPAALPVVLFSHGLGGLRTTYSTVCTDLASHGFLVAAIEHRYAVPPRLPADRGGGCGGCWAAPPASPRPSAAARAPGRLTRLVGTAAPP